MGFHATYSGVPHVKDREVKPHKGSQTGVVGRSPTLMRSAVAVEKESAIPYPERPPITPGEKQLTEGLATGLALRVDVECLASERLKRIELFEQNHEALRIAAAEAGTQRAAREELQHKWCTALEQAAEQRAARDEAERKCGVALEQAAVQRATCSEVERNLSSALEHTEKERDAREKVECQLADTLRAHKTACEEGENILAEASAERRVMSDIARVEAKSHQQASLEVECRLTEAFQQVDVQRARREELEVQVSDARDAQQIYIRRLAEAERQADAQRALHEEALKHQEIYARILREAEKQADAQRVTHGEAKGKLAEAWKHQEIYVCRLEEAEKQADAQRAMHKEKEGQLAEALNSEQIYVRRLDDALQQVDRNRKSLPDAEQLKVQIEQHKRAREAAEEKAAMVLEQLEAEREARRAFEVKVEDLKTAAQTHAAQTACQRFQGAARNAKLAHEGQDWETLQQTEEELRKQVELLEREHGAAERQLADSNQSLLTQRSALSSLELSLSKICGNMDEAVTEWLPWSDLKDVQGQLKTTQLIVQEALNHHEIIF